MISKIRNNTLFYFLFTSFFLLMIWFIINQGQNLEINVTSSLTVNTDQITNYDSFFGSLINAMIQNFNHAINNNLSLMFLQIAIIIFMARLFGFICYKIGQPTVIGEMAAGIFLGPSFLGTWWPEISSILFNPVSLGRLDTLSNLGLVLFVFIVGLELDSSLLKNQANTAIIISHASIVVPFFLGVLVSYFIYPTLSYDTVPFLSFSLFMGIAMSLTAFPVLARIIQERKLTKSILGTLSLTCAAADDVTAWCLLAAVVGIIRADTLMTFIATIVQSLIYIIFMFYIAKPFLQILGDICIPVPKLRKGLIALLFIFLFLSAFCTEIIGIHALFGAFLAGIASPSQIDFRKILIDRIQVISMVILLPIFFAINGLKTQIGLLNDSYLWFVCIMIIIVAIIGKFGGSAIAARYTGLPWGVSLSIGALMNTRGLVELVVLGIGYELGILTPVIFTMMVVMALVTTFMTKPMLSLIEKFFDISKEEKINSTN